MEENPLDIQLQSEESDPFPSEQDALSDELVRQTIRLRERAFWFVFIFYGLTLTATLALFYLSGLGILSFSDNVLISLSGVVIGELGVGAILMQIVKSIFTDA
ncbi:MAG: hypothetical protein IIC22_06510 [Chloroflexi bacterium]|nr:hypothetical protein [Chloroflexota bacterium]